MGIGAEPVDDNGRPVVGWDSTNHRPAVPQITSTSVDANGVVYGTLATSSGGGGSGGAVTAVSGAFVDGAIATIGTEADAAITNPASSGTLLAFIKGVLTQLGFGQKTKANSLSVTVASDQGAVSTQDTNSAAIKSDLDTLVINTADLLADGDNLPTIQTNTANIPPKGTAVMTGSTPVTIATNDTVFVELLSDTDNLATIQTNTANIPAKGANTTANSQPVNIASDQTVPVNMTKVGGSSIAPGNNALPVLSSAATGYVTAYGSNLGATVATTDYLFKWGAGGLTQVNHIMLQNNTGANIQYDLDVAANAGSPILATGQTLFIDVQTSVLHLYTAAIQNVNGAVAGNIVVRGWL